MRKTLIALCCAALCLAPVSAKEYEKDVIETSAGDVEITFLGHGTLMLTFGGKVIHVDPFSRVADYSTLPKADLVLITHQHGDHADPEALEHIRTDDTEVWLSAEAAKKVDGGAVMKNGDLLKMPGGIQVEAVPAYNLVHKRESGEFWHPKGEGNGYVVTLGGVRFYFAGDTENTPEMKALKDIDYAFLPMNLPYTMTPEMVADAARVFKPKVLYPYHYGKTDPQRLVELLKDTPEIEVRVRQMQ